MIPISGAYKWLNKFDDKKTFLSPSSQYLWKNIWEDLKQGKTAKIGPRLADLVYICERSNQVNESAEACLNGGIAYFYMDKANKSINLLRKAISGYQLHRHNQTVVRWILGYVLLVRKDQREEAIIEWKNCVLTYRELNRTHRFESKKADWYQEKLEEMDSSIKYVAAFAKKKLKRK